jgi:PadR family transcriptional regulator, regulatory protein PadR
MAKPTELLPGTLDMLILKAVSLKPLHGYGVLLRIGQMSGNALEIPQGSLYPALYRLEHQRLITARWGASDNNRKAKFYTLTRKGRAAAQAEHEAWLRLSKAVTRVLRALEQGV